MKSCLKALLIVVVMVLGAGLAHASETAPITSDYLENCVVDEGSDCEARCLTEHNCCIKSCNWVEPKAKSKCIEHCKTILEKCNRECDEKPAADTAAKGPAEADPCSEPAD